MISTGIRIRSGLGVLEFVLVEDPATELALFEAGISHLANHLPAGS